MSEPVTPAAALAAVQKEPKGTIRRWQERNRMRRDNNTVSDFIYWMHTHALGIDEDAAMRAAIRAEPDDYLASFAGLAIFAVFGLPLNVIRLVKKMHSKVYYGE